MEKNITPYDVYRDNIQQSYIQLTKEQTPLMFKEINRRPTISHLMFLGRALFLYTHSDVNGDNIIPSFYILMLNSLSSDSQPRYRGAKIFRGEQIMTPL